MAGTYQIDPATLLLPASDQPLPEGDAPPAPVSILETPQLREQIQKIRERLDRMGAINLAAIDEHRELEERYQFLTTQEQDLSTSIASLKEIIQRINRTTKDMFVETFNELQQKFRDVFSQFFPGGRAELQLVEEPLEEGVEDNGAREPGVEIVAQPPGKRLKSITMLSGGEKTLTAMALLIASFLIRPPPGMKSKKLPLNSSQRCAIPTAASRPLAPSSACGRSKRIARSVGCAARIATNNSP